MSGSPHNNANNTRTDEQRRSSSLAQWRKRAGRRLAWHRDLDECRALHLVDRSASCPVLVSVHASQSRAVCPKPDKQPDQNIIKPAFIAMRSRRRSRAFLSVPQRSCAFADPQTAACSRLEHQTCSTVERRWCSRVALIVQTCGGQTTPRTLANAPAADRQPGPSYRMHHDPRPTPDHGPWHSTTWNAIPE